MKKIAILIAVLLLIFAAGCANEAAQDPTAGPTQPAPTQATEPVTQPEVTEPLTEATVAATEAPTVPEETVVEEPAFTEEFDLSSAQERYRINIFLSNFSEQEFNEFSAHVYQPVTTAFQRESAAPAEYVNFAFLWYGINAGRRMGDDGRNFYLTMDQLNEKLDRYFGKTLTRAEFENSGYAMSGDRVLTPAAYGDSHPNLTIAQQMLGDGQGRYLVRYSIFTWEEVSSGGDMVYDKNWYYLNAAEANADQRLTHYSDGYAIVEEYHKGDVDSYNLISYWLDGQTEP